MTTIGLRCFRGSSMTCSCMTAKLLSHCSHYMNVNCLQQSPAILIQIHIVSISDCLYYRKAYNLLSELQHAREIGLAWNAIFTPNVAKRSIWHQCKKKYILRTDRRPATDRRPTDLSFGLFPVSSNPRWRLGRHLGKFKWRYLRGGSSDLRRVWF